MLNTSGAWFRSETVPAKADVAICGQKTEEYLGNHTQKKVRRNGIYLNHFTMTQDHLFRVDKILSKQALPALIHNH